MFVLDASAALAWFFEDEATAESVNLLRSINENRPIVPTVWPLEVANTLLIAERRKRISAQMFDDYVQRLAQFNIEVESNDDASVLTHVLPLARQHALSSYDASYLELAVRRRLPLASRDERLKRAAVSAGVELIPA